MADQPCLRCAALDQAVPPEATLRILATEDWDAEAIDFIPRAMNQQQAVAAEMLIVALGRYVKAFGVDIAGRRLSAFLGILRAAARTTRAHHRIIEARQEINARVRKVRETGGGEGEMRAIEAEPTPDYPGKDRDDAWLRGDMRG